MVLGHAVVGGDGPGREVVGGGDASTASRRAAPCARPPPTPGRQELRTALGIKTQSRRRRTCGPPRSCGSTPIAAIPAPDTTRARLRPSQAGLRRARGRITRRPACACGSVRPMDPADVKLWAQKWRWYERNSLPVEPRAHPPRVRAAARRSAAGPCTATCSRCCARAGSSSASTCCSSRTSGSPRRRPGGSASAAAASSTWACRSPRSSSSRSARTACSPTAASSPTATTASTTPTGRCRGRASRRKGPTRIGDNVWCGAHVVVTSGVTVGERCVIGANSRRHARPAAVLDRGRRAGARAPDARYRRLSSS